MVSHSFIGISFSYELLSTYCSKILTVPISIPDSASASASASAGAGASASASARLVLPTLVVR